MHTAKTIDGPHAGKSVLGNLARSSIGAKWVMAVTGGLFVLWLLLHLAGNLQIFRGAEPLNAYGALLAKEPMLLWGQRIGLFVVVILHVAAGLRLWYLNRNARTQRYAAGYRYRRATWVTRTMAFSGLLLLAFILFHLAHFTFGWVYPSEFKPMAEGSGIADIYTMMVGSFRRGGIAAIYVLAMALLAMHLSHGIWSALQTMGLNGKRWTPFALQGSRAAAAIIAAAFAAIPIAVLIGIIRH
ncbi:MAG TPA: succinate dehydrogenase cytochrome b subunit [Vulgatibacter sp.]|nr:succinate dehydrogenase cytochrome b subunit [Vulgatibacter sp.]